MSSRLDDLRQLLMELDDSAQPILFSRLYALSDLSREQLTEFCAAWDLFSADRRRKVVRALVELAEASFQFNFDAIFRYCLDDPDSMVRATAIDGLWENEGADLIGPFLTKLRADPSAQVRAAAASGLGRYVLAGELDQLESSIQARITTELLTITRLVDESIEVRRRAIESVSYACTPEVHDILELAYYDDDEKMRISAVVGMGRTCDRRWKDVLLQELGSDSPAMRYEAAWACGEMTLRQAVPLLARLINDPDRQVCNASIWALGQIGGSQAKHILLTAYDGADEDTRVALDEALAEQALFEGNMDFLLYEVDSDVDDSAFDNEFVSLWSANYEDNDDFDPGDWDLDNF